MQVVLSRPLVLASASPRRAELLRQVGIPFTVMPAHSEETPPGPGEDLLTWACGAALEKARATAHELSARPSLILGADTVVLVPAAAGPTLDGRPVQVLGKPRDAVDAGRMLRRLAGRAHWVVTGMAVLCHPEGEAVSNAVVTTVRFRDLTDAEIGAYVASGEPLDKAGAYGIQGAGAVLVRDIAGDYANVVGLPLSRLWELLAPWRG